MRNGVAPLAGYPAVDVAADRGPPCEPDHGGRGRDLVPVARTLACPAAAGGSRISPRPTHDLPRHLFLFGTGATMQYRVQFLDRSDNVIREVRADDISARTVLFRRSINRACPPNGVRMRVLDHSGRASVSRTLGRELLA